MLDQEAHTIRRRLRAGDAEAIVDLHRRVYEREYGRNAAFIAAVADSVRAAVDRGWPESGGAAWLIDGEAERTLAGCLGLTRESATSGKVRWFVLTPALRGHGLGQRLMAELMDEARAQGMTRLELDTYSELGAAARIYRALGFVVVSAVERADWGPPITYQRYTLDL